MLLAGTYTGIVLLTFSKTSNPNSGGVLPSKVIDVRFEQYQNALSPILVTEFGIVIEVRPVHSPKASSPILVTEFGIVIEVRLWQL